MLKLMILPRSPPGMSREAMHRHLEHVHGPLCLQHSEVGGHFRRYIHHYARTGAVDPTGVGPVLADRDALTVIVFDDATAFRSSTSSAVYRNVIAPDESNFSLREESLFFFADEVIVRAGILDSTSKLFHLRKLVDGMDPASASAIWCDRVRDLLAEYDGGGTVLNYIHNRLCLPDGAQPAYDAIDEIGFENESSLTAFGEALARAESGIFVVGTTVAMITRPKLFVG